MEVGRHPLDDRLGLHRGAGRERVRVEPRAVGVEAGGGGGGGDGHGELAHPNGRDGAAEAEARPHRLQRDHHREDGDAAEEAGVEVGPEREERREQPADPSAAGEVALGDQQRPGGEREGGDLGTGAEDGLGGPGAEQ